MATKKDVLEQSQKAVGDFFNAAKCLLGEDAPYDVNELSNDSPVYETAKDIAEEMGLDWEKMSHDESNRVILNVLTEYFCAIKPEEGYEPLLTISFKEKATSKNPE